LVFCSFSVSGLAHSWRSLANIHVASSDLIETKRSIIILCLYSLKQRRFLLAPLSSNCFSTTLLSFLLRPHACISRIPPLLRFLDV
jgi:hypothetical protein